jgi:hypothetical protein
MQQRLGQSGERRFIFPRIIKRYINEKDGRLGRMVGPSKDYVKEHLLDYANFQVQQGYLPEDVAKVLRKTGYSKVLVDDIIGGLDPVSLTPKKEHPPIREMDRSMEAYVNNMLIDFIMKERKSGYDDAAIRKALLRFGHHQKAVDNAFVEINTGNAVDYAELRMIQVNPQILLALSMLLFFTFSVFLSISTNVTIVVVLLSLCPSGAAVLVVYFLSFFIAHSYRQLLPLLGAALALAGYFMLAQISSVIQGLPGAQMIVMLNIVIAFILSGVFAFMAKRSEDAILEKAQGRKKDEQEILYDMQVPDRSVD